MKKAEDFDVKGIYKTPITDCGPLCLGIYKITSRDFELSFEQEFNRYCIEVFTPSTKADWEIALLYIKELAKKIGSDIVTDNNEHFTVDTIESFDYEKMKKIFCLH